MKRETKPEPATEPVTEPAIRTVTCVVPNVWTSAGRILKGDAIELPRAEAEALIENGQVK